MSSHRVVSREEWIAARKALLSQEKELTRLRDQVSQARRDLPWVKVRNALPVERSKSRSAISKNLS